MDVGSQRTIFNKNHFDENNNCIKLETTDMCLILKRKKNRTHRLFSNKLKFVVLNLKLKRNLLQYVLKSSKLRKANLMFLFKKKN